MGPITLLNLGRMHGRSDMSDLTRTRYDIQYALGLIERSSLTREYSGLSALELRP